MIDVQKAKKALTGPISSVSTPFNKDGSIDYKSLCNLVDFIIEEGKSGTVLLTYGDSLYVLLTDDEIAEVTKVVSQHTAGRAMVVAATGRWWTGKSIEFAEYAKEVGADVLMSLPPEWCGCNSAENIAQHYKEIGKIIPTMVVTSYGVGGGRGLPLESMRMLLDKDANVVAIKDDVAGYYGKQMATLVDGRWAVLSGGRKINHLDIMPYGVDGYLSAFTRFCPSVAHQYWDYIESGNIPEAAKIIQKYDMPYFDVLVPRVGTDFDLVVHASMEVFGLASRWRRMPFVSASKSIKANQGF